MEINLDGGEISIIKALGTGGSEVSGEDLIARVPHLEGGEVLETLKGLLMLGYISADKNSFHDFEGMKKIHFRVNSGYAKDLREALDPTPDPKRSKRVRRE